MTPAPTLVDTAALIDGRSFSGLQIRVFVFCALVAMLDGVDSQAIGVAGPLIAAGLNMPMSRFAPAISAGLLGAALGALFVGPLGDRFGRRTMLIAATLEFGLFTIATAFPTDFTTLVVLRFLAGLGLGGATPCFISLGAEYAPLAKRETMTTVLWSAYPLGNGIGGLISGYLVSHHTWQSVFLVAGIPTIVLGTAMFFWLPESLRFLARTGSRPAYAESLARLIRADLPGGPLRLTLPKDDAPLPVGNRVSVRNLFEGGRTAGTLLLWVMLFCGFATTTVTTVMSPTLLREGGIPLGTAGNLVALFSLGSVISMALSGRLIQMFGPVRALVPAFLLGAILLATLGQLTSVPLLAICMALLGLTVPLGASGAIALAASFYPTAMRSSGVGWAMGFARLGQVCSPLIIGGMLGLGLAVQTILIALALAPIIAGLSTLLRTLLSRQTVVASRI